MSMRLRPNLTRLDFRSPYTGHARRINVIRIALARDE